MNEKLLPNPIKEFADCSFSLGTTIGVSPANAGYQIPFRTPEMTPTTISRRTLGESVMKETAAIRMRKLRVMSESPITRARPNLSAIAPPTISSINIGNVLAAITALRDTASAPSIDRTPKARATGETPLPKFEIERAANIWRKYGTADSSLSDLIKSVLVFCARVFDMLGVRCQ
jgi:hypothetical protein